MATRATEASNGRKKAATVIDRKVDPKGGVAWTLRVDGSIHTVKTTKSAVTSIDRAAAKHGKTLERLAKK